MSKGSFLLETASEAANLEAFEILFTKGAEPNGDVLGFLGDNREEETKAGRLQILKYLIKHYDKLNEQHTSTYGKLNILWCASWLGTFGLIEMLLKNSNKGINEKCGQGGSVALHKASYYGKP